MGCQLDHRFLDSDFPSKIDLWGILFLWDCNAAYGRGVGFLYARDEGKSLDDFGSSFEDTGAYFLGEKESVNAEAWRLQMLN